MTDRQTIDVYNQRADEYDQLDMSDTPSDALAGFIAKLPAAAHVLDLGCGPGTSSRHMARAGLRVDAMDASPEMVALASRIDGVSARVGSFDDLDAQGVYDGIWANFSLLHASKSDMPRHLAAVHTALTPKGVFHVAVKEGTGDARDRLGRYYAYYTVSEMTDLLNQQGFRVGDLRQGTDRGLDGSMAAWFSVLAYA
ncbi:class I SAM-dependent methyltransferase [Marivita sp. S6314]|uniref:class I SAM-dependent DNA methyltransferase n=1 Tax=Marivita sp. S6314 TaxID=2926406 RepID=UPI001FF31FAF|nr:class I SAM-dependent methyltransferase [Marivita sp. S6314]